jgi:hypothetical protein
VEAWKFPFASVVTEQVKDLLNILPRLQHSLARPGIKASKRLTP